MLENVHQHNIMFSYVRMEDEGWRWRWRGYEKILNVNDMNIFTKLFRKYACNVRNECIEQNID